MQRGYVPMHVLVNSDEPAPKRHCAERDSYATRADLSGTESGSSLVSPPPPPPPASTPPVVTPDKFTKSRAVGQVHRDNERAMIATLEQEVESLRLENVLMFAMFCTQYKQQKLHRLRRLRPEDGELMDDWMTPEDKGMTEEDAIRLGWHSLGADTAERLGVRFMSSRMGRVLLEVILFRRNLVPSETSTLNRKRRRRAVREPTNAGQALAVCDFAFNLFKDEAHELGIEDKAWYIDRKFAGLMYIVGHWSQYEKDHNAPAFEYEDEGGEFPPYSPTRPDAAEFGSPNRRRGEGAKRCSRCNALKFTGSGHGRSKCDDGYSISSSIPYPASPRSEGHSS